MADETEKGLTPVADGLAELDEEFALIEEELQKARSAGELPPEYDDWIENPNDNLSFRQRELCRLIAKGFKNKDVCLTLGYSPSRVSILLRNPLIRKEILKFQDKVFNADLVQRIDEVAPDAMNIIEAALGDESQLRPTAKVDLAKWVMEKKTGKPRQLHEIETGSLMDLYARLDNMKNVRDVLETGMEAHDSKIVDIEPVKHDYIADWFKKEIDGKE